jgi:hypothetical protein
MTSLVADPLQTAGTRHLVTVDAHSAQLEAFFRIPVDNPTAVPTLCDLVHDRVPEDAVVVAPDAQLPRHLRQRPLLLDHQADCFHLVLSRVQPSLLCHGSPPGWEDTQPYLGVHCSGGVSNSIRVGTGMEGRTGSRGGRGGSCCGRDVRFRCGPTRLAAGGACRQPPASDHEPRSTRRS